MCLQRNLLAAPPPRALEGVKGGNGFLSHSLHTSITLGFIKGGKGSTACQMGTTQRSRSQSLHASTPWHLRGGRTNPPRARTAPRSNHGNDPPPRHHRFSPWRHPRLRGDALHQAEPPTPPTVTPPGGDGQQGGEAVSWVSTRLAHPRARKGTTRVEGPPPRNPSPTAASSAHAADHSTVRARQRPILLATSPPSPGHDPRLRGERITGGACRGFLPRGFLPSPTAASSACAVDHSTVGHGRILRLRGGPQHRVGVHRIPASSLSGALETCSFPFSTLF